MERVSPQAAPRERVGTFTGSQRDQATEKFEVKQVEEKEMFGDWRNPVVPVDVVQGIVHQLSEVSQHTTQASTAMRHLVAEIAQLPDFPGSSTAGFFGQWADLPATVGNSG